MINIVQFQKSSNLIDHHGGQLTFRHRVLDKTEFIVENSENI